MISVQAAAAEPDPVPPLEKVWVLVYGLPRGGCAAPRRLTFELESPAPVDPLGPTKVVLEPGDGGLDDEGGSLEDGSSSEGDDDDGGAPPAPSDDRRNPDSLAAGPPGLAGDPPVVALVPMTAVDTGSSPPGAAVPAVVAEVEVSVGMEVCPASSPRSPGVVFYSHSLGSPPSPTLGSPATGLLPAADLGWVSETPPAPRSRPREGASPVVAARQNARISQSRILQDGRIPTICFRTYLGHNGTIDVGNMP
ncbi:hypothetical protein ZWY2020_052305 [Hordeum vulgare]|nr:hypothetical protein ZWY2020_052305 [Hordeum vulgare]